MSSEFDNDSDETSGGHSEQKAKEAESLDAKTTYEVVRREGERELERSSDSLFWSGLAAGLSMGFSFLTEAFLRSHLPEADWRPLIAKAGYSVGFLIVILGSQQLYTENTLTPIVPLLHRWSRERLLNVLRLEAVVLIANIIGAFLFALALAKLEVVEPQAERALSSLSGEALKHGAGVTFLHAIYAGWIVALMVWMLPAAETAKVVVIILMTYLIGIGGFAHIVAGASEVFYAALRHEAAWSDIIVRYLLPTLAGNTLGGITLVTALNHAQATSDD